MYKRLLVGGLILTFLVTGCAQSPAKIPTPTPASEAAETPTPVPSTTPESITTAPTTPTAKGQQNEGTTFSPKDYVPAGPDSEFDNFTWTLPTGASPLRLSLPAEMEDIFYSEKTGVGGFGLHAGGHIEGLDHVWIELKPGTPVRSWADGVVEDVRLSGMVDQGEYHVTTNYGQNLIGIHMEIETPYVKKGDRVKRGQEVGLGMSFDPEQSSAEFSLIDLGRTDGVTTWNNGVYVSPYDYLEDSDKKKLVEAYQKSVIEPYQKEYSLSNMAPTLIAPKQNATVKINPITGRAVEITFIWERPSDNVTAYQLKIAMEEGFGEEVQDITVTESGGTANVVVGPYASETLEFQFETTYFWKVMVSSPSKSPYSEVRRFTIDKALVQPPVVVKYPPVPPAPDITVTPPNVIVNVPPLVQVPPAPAPITSPAWIWVMVIIGGVLVIALIVLMVRTIPAV